jgi:membrane fusion protein (multidrug efflux system)
MSEQKKKNKSPLKLIIIGLILLLGLFFGIKKIRYSLTHETTDNAQIECQITPILPRTSGYIKALNVLDYDSISKNQFLVELDDAELQNQLAAAQADSIQTYADYNNSIASLTNAQVALQVNKGAIDVANVKLQQALNEYNRNKNLFAEQAITQKQLDESKFTFQQIQKSYDNTVNELSSAQSKLPVLETVVNKYESLLKLKNVKIEEIKLKLSYTKILAPASGKIGKKNIAIGQFVQAGTPLFSIVNDSTFWITANFKENQINHLYVGKKVDLRIDAFPDEKITGTIESISDATGAKFALLPPDNSSGNFVKVTQRVPVKIKIDQIEKYKKYLRAGLSVFVSAAF